VPRIRIAETGELFSAEDGETILAAAQRAGLPFSYSCQAGNCGSCKCELVEGDIFELEHSQYALSPAEHAQGLILACRSQAWGEATIRRLSDEDIVVHPSRILDCRVAHLESLTHDITGLRLETGDAGSLVFSAGQYVNIDFAPGLAKHYSMANTPMEDMLEFQIRRMPGGRCSSFVADDLREGDSVVVSGPQGTSYLREQHRGPVLLIAGGSGLAPMQSILRTMLARGHPASIRLYFGVRAERDVYNELLLQDLARQHGNFRYEIVLSEEGSARRGAGFVHDAVEHDLASVEGYKAYLAGPPAMVEAATAMLKAKGLASRDIHADAFYNQ
jgi:ferredoxin-NAD(P)+ reductase (naphthalene dioxygenase ferredoxin-specific)